MNRNLWWGIARSLLIYYAIPGRLRAMRRLYGQFIAPGDLCFDIGAHVGSRLRAWRGLGARIVAAEPEPTLMRLLQRLYGRSPHVTLCETAVGAEIGRAPFYVSPRTPTVSTLSPEWIDAVQQDASFAHVAWQPQGTVPVTTLDALIAAYGRPAFCKIDVEGYEADVLRGLSQPLPALSIEYIPAALDTALACIAQLSALASYEYNWSPGEQHCLQASRWLSAAEMTAVLQQLTPQDGSGDIYARRLFPRS